MNPLTSFQEHELIAIANRLDENRRLNFYAGLSSSLPTITNT
ncbi:MAG: hypothetical protein ABSE48_20665 [Verrucomicrobiota bacterium]|jgi:hypothetical protein